MSPAVTAPSLLAISETTCGFAAVRLEQYLLQIQHDIGHILDDAVNGGEFVRRAVDFDRADGGAFERTEQHAAQ